MGDHSTGHVHVDLFFHHSSASPVALEGSTCSFFEQNIWAIISDLTNLVVASSMKKVGGSLVLGW